jgi:hypothetical protein
VNLRGAIVSLSKRIKMAIEIETGSLITEQVSNAADASTTQPKARMFPPDSCPCRPSRTIQMYRAVTTWLDFMPTARALNIACVTSSQGVDKRTYFFTPVMVDTKELPEDARKEQRRKDKDALDNWYGSPAAILHTF